MTLVLKKHTTRFILLIKMHNSINNLYFTLYWCFYENTCISGKFSKFTTFTQQQIKYKQNIF